MKSFLKISFISLLTAIPVMADAAPRATAVTLVNNGDQPSATQRVATTSYVQGAYNMLGTQVNNIINDTTVPEATGYTAIGSDKSVSENLVALDSAVRDAAGEVGTYLTKDNAFVIPVEDATLNYLGETTAGTNIGLNFGILDNQIKLNQSALETLNGTGPGSVSAAIAVETERATTAETGLGNRIGTLAQDGRYILQNNSVSANLSALDEQVETNATNIGTITALSTNGNLTGDSRSSLVSAINALDAAISSAGTSSNVTTGHYIGTENNRNSVAENLIALDTQVYNNAKNIGNNIADMGTEADTITGAIKEMHQQKMRVATTWEDDTAIEMDLFTNN